MFLERLCKASDGRYFKNGAEWNLNDCTTCECRKGVILCSVEDCKYKGPKAIKGFYNLLRVNKVTKILMGIYI